MPDNRSYFLALFKFVVKNGKKWKKVGYNFIY